MRCFLTADRQVLVENEVWREPDWPWLGKELYRRLARVAAERYGERLERFEVDVPAEEYLRFDND